MFVCSQSLETWICGNMSSVQKPCGEIEQCAKDQAVYSTNSYYWFVAHCLENWGDAGPQDRIELFLWPVHKLCLTWELPVWESTHPPCAIFRDKFSRREEEWLPKMFTSTLSKAQYFLWRHRIAGNRIFSFGQVGLDPVWAHPRTAMPAFPTPTFLTLAADLILLFELFNSCTWTADLCGTCHNNWCGFYFFWLLPRCFCVRLLKFL